MTQPTVSSFRTAQASAWLGQSRHPQRLGHCLPLQIQTFAEAYVMETLEVCLRTLTSPMPDDRPILTPWT